MAKQLQLKTPVILIDDVAEVTPQESVFLLQMLNGLRLANNSLPASAGKFVGKNLKKLTAQNTKNLNAEKALRKEYDAIFDYPEKYTNGADIWWDGIADDIKYKTEGDEQVEDKETSVYGVKAWHDVKTNKLVDIATNQVIPDEKANTMKVYIKDEEKAKEYEDKKKEFFERFDKLNEVKSEVNVLRISLDYLEENRIIIPTRMLNEKTKTPFQLDLDTFYEYLVIDGEKTPDSLKN